MKEFNYNNIIEEIKKAIKFMNNGSYVSFIDVIDIINRNTFPIDMNENIKNPEEQYRNDPSYREICNTLESLIEEGKFSPNEVHEMFMLSCLHYKWSRINPFR
jgi:hypothetical protein